MKAKVNVVLNQSQSGRPVVFVELVDTTIEAANSPNKKWTINVPNDNPVSASELKLILRQLGLENKYLPKTGHKVVCDADAFYYEGDNGRRHHYILVQISKDIRRIFKFDPFQNIGVMEGAKFHFEFEKKVSETDIVSLAIPVEEIVETETKPEIKTPKTDAKKQ